MWTYRALTPLPALVLALGACSSDPPPATPEVGDASSDAERDVRVVDSGFDAGVVDSGREARSEAGAGDASDVLDAHPGGDAGVPDAPDARTEPLLVDAPTAPVPERFSDVGFFTDMDPRRPHARAMAYQPMYPLWSNGSDKARWLLLPPGEAIAIGDGPVASASELPVWEFPIGTLIFKSFSYPDEAGVQAPVETRLIRRAADGEWEFAAYVWNEDHSEAYIGDRFASIPLPVVLDGEAFEHTVPSGLECATCHEGAEQRVLGLNPLQLAADQLSALADAGAFETLPEPLEVEAGTPEATQVLGFFVGNCIHCHNAWPDSPDPAFSLRPDVAFDNLIGQETTASGSASGFRVVAGDPAASVLFQALSGETQGEGLRQMPPLGIDRRDTESIEVIRSWITGLEENEAPE